MLDVKDISSGRKDWIIYGLIDIFERETELIYPAEAISEVMTEEEMEVYCWLLLNTLREHRESIKM